MAQKVTIAHLLETPADYLYIFAETEFLARLSARRRAVISSKKAIQRKYVNTVAVDNGSTLSAVKRQLYDRLKEVYGMTPAQMLVKLAMGENVAGKDWDEGVYGVGAVKTTAFVQDASVTVDNATGKLLHDGVEIAGQIPVYKSRKGKSYISGWSATLDGKQYSSAIDEKAYRKGDTFYYSSTYGTGDTVQWADGSAYDPAAGGSVWENILSFMPMLGKFLTWIASLFGIQTMTATEVAPAQVEFLDDTGPSLASVGLLAVAALAVVSVSPDKKKGKGKRKK